MAEESPEGDVAKGAQSGYTKERRNVQCDDWSGLLGVVEERVD
jgi:hypothetical protein